MADSHAAPSAARFEVRGTAADHFAWVRTRLALERTIMAWLRTAVALIGFGFAIVQYFQRLGQMPGVGPAYTPNAAYYLGLALISCGVLALVISIWQYWWTMRYLWSASFAPDEDEKDRDRDDRRSQSLLRHSRNRGEGCAPQITHRPPVLPDRDHKGQNAA